MYFNIKFFERFQNLLERKKKVSYKGSEIKMALHFLTAILHIEDKGEMLS